MFLSSLFCLNVFAKEIIFINAGTGGATGSNAVYSKEIINELNQKGFNVDLKVTNGNCAIAKNIWDKSSEPVIFIASTNSEGTTQKQNFACFIETTRKNFLYHLDTGVTSFCSIGNKTWNDFIKKNSSHIVITMMDSNQEKFIQEIGKEYQLSLKTLRVLSYNDAITLIKSKEADFIFRVSIHTLPELEGKCFWNHAEIDEKKLFPKLTHMSDIYNKFGEQKFLMSKGLTDQEINDLRLYIKNVLRNSVAIKNQVEKRGRITFDWNTKEEFEIIADKFFQGY
jgi:hypothetical protein